MRDLTEAETDALRNPEWLHYVATGKVPVWLTPEARDALKLFLTHHAKDIATPGQWDDWAILQGVYEAVMK